MTYPSIAIIGTAGRKEDKAKLTHQHYDRLFSAVVKLMLHLGLDSSTLKAYSGGAAWADHLVVTLALRRGVDPKNVTLFLPAVLTPYGYDGVGDQIKKTADTANYYHRLFSHCTGFNSIEEIADIANDGAVLVPGTGSFHARNSDVAKSVSPDGILLACTFGSPESTQAPWTIRPFGSEVKADEAGLKDGGTADTWNKSRAAMKWHLRIGEDA